MPSAHPPKKRSPTGELLLGVSLYSLASKWPELVGGPLDAAAHFYIGFFKWVGVLAIATGITGHITDWNQARRRKEAEETSGTFGEAAFATLEECEAAGLTNPEGLYLGLLDGQPLFYSGKAHLLTCAPARQGKGIGFVIPNLLHYPGSVVVTDPKGELAAVTAAHRRSRLGHRVVVLNPWGLHGLPQDRINPLAVLIVLASDPRLQRGLSDEVRAIVLVIYPEPEDPRNFYFREGTRSIIRFSILSRALLAPKRCTLPEVWRLVASPKRLERAIEEARRSDALGGVLADLADDLAAQMKENPEHFEDFRSGALQVLSIYEPGGYLADAVSGSDVSLADLKTGKVSVYLALPQDRIATHGAVLGLIVSQAITAVARSEAKGKVLFLLDEFANMGKLSGLAESLTALPGLGVRVWMIVQELADITRIYGPNTAKTVLSQSDVKQFFGVNSGELAQTLSRALGQKTVKTRSYNLGREVDDEISESMSESGQPLMRPEDVLLMKQDEQLLFINRVRPVLAQRIPFWFVSPWGRWATPNPVEGEYPEVKPLVRLDYPKQENDHE